MALRMANLTRTSSGLWTSRKVIPEDVRASYGKREDKPTWPASLTQREAMVAFTSWLHEVESRIESLRRVATAKTTSLNSREISALVGQWYGQLLLRFEDDPGSPLSWECDLEATEPDSVGSSSEPSPEDVRWTPIAFVQDQLEDLLLARALVVTSATRQELLQAMLSAYRAFCRLMLRRSNGDYGADPMAGTFALLEQPTAPAAKQHLTTGPKLMDLFDGYVRERQPAAASVKSFRAKIGNLIGFLGHDDASRVTPEDIVRWKDHLLSEELPNGEKRAARTVAQTYLPAARTVFAWACENLKVSSNPVTAVRVRAPKTIQLRDSGFTDQEAAQILKATLTAAPTRSETLSHARRWVPWLCAYSGARVNEITQLRAQDIVEVDGVWCMNITPEAGSVKTHQARLVPLHPHLIEQGFLRFAKDRPGPLFYDPSKHRGGSDGNPQSKKVGERLASWVRSIGVEDPRIAPNHAWRHRFKTVAREAKLDHEARDRLTGHAPASEGSSYGHWSPRALKNEIDKLPRYYL